LDTSFGHWFYKHAAPDGADADSETICYKAKLNFTPVLEWSRLSADAMSDQQQRLRSVSESPRAGAPAVPAHSALGSSHLLSGRFPSHLISVWDRDYPGRMTLQRDGGNENTIPITYY